MRRRLRRARAFPQLALIALALAACPGPRGEPEAKGSEAPGEVRVEGARVRLAEGAAERMGLEVVAAGPARASLERVAFGRVLDPLALVEPVLARSAARRGLEPARSEYERSRALYERDRNASTRDVENARLAYERASLEARTAATRVVAAWGPAAAQRADLEALADRLAEGSAAVGRLDPQAGEAPGALPEVVSVALPGSPGPALAARVLGPAPTADPVLQTRGFLVLFEGDPPAPGTSLVAHLAVQGAPLEGAWLPASAVLWHDGEAVAFVEAGDRLFERRAIARLRSLDGGWLVGAGVRPGERVVVRAAQQLLAAQVLPADAAD